MPTVSISSQALFKALDHKYTEKEFHELCFDFGIELDDVVMEEGKEIYKIDLPANRYDLLCLEGLSRALLIFLKKKKAPIFKAFPPQDTLALNVVVVKKETKFIRPFVCAAVLKNITFTKENYESFIALQDQLHRNICRKRTLVAIGTHDLDSIQGPYTYEALPPKDIKFRHLFGSKEMNGKEMLDWFRNDPEGKHIKEYTDIIYDSAVYPVIMDKNRTVMSLPPIINGYHSKISLDTKNVFIECTATDLTKCNVVLNTMLAMFSQYCSEPFTAEQVLVQYEKGCIASMSGKEFFYPDFTPRKAFADLEELKGIVGVDLSEQKISELCDRMQLGPAVVKTENGAKCIEVTVPVTRSDILHACDIAEDVAIAFGYNNIAQSVPVSHHPGKELPINYLSDIIRNDLGRFGYTELMSFALCSHDENFKNLNRADRDDEAVKLANPKTIEFQVLRTSLLPGALKTLGENKSLKFSDGIKLFEVTDVVKLVTDFDKRGQQKLVKPDERDIGCKNERHVVCVYAGPTAGVEVIHGTIDRIMQSLSVIPDKDYCPEAFENPFAQNLLRNDAHFGYYTVKPMEQSEGHVGTFFPGMCAELHLKRRGTNIWIKIGEFGALHPSVVEAFKLGIPCSTLEINIEPFV